MADEILDTSKYLNQWTEQKVSFNQRDLLLYAVGIGCDDLNFVYEHDENFAAFPSYPIVLSFKGTDQDVVSFPSEAMAKGPELPPFDGIRVVLDGERSIEQFKPLNPEGEELTLKQRIIGVQKKGKGASLESEAQLINKDGELVYKLISGAFLVGAKNFTESGVSNSEKITVPDRAPDNVVEIPTTKTQAQVYRLSGDYNPLHVDPGMAGMSGFEEPILHGLCSLGITIRALLRAYCDNDPAMFRSIKARFAKPVLPGQTLQVKMWKEGDRVVLNTVVLETGQVCINNAYATLNPKSKM